MPQQFTACLGPKAFTLDEGIVSNCGAQCFAPANAFVHGLASGGYRHGLEPPALFWGQRFPVVQGVGYRGHGICLSKNFVLTVRKSATQACLITIKRISLISSMAYLTPSRPMPESFTPP